MWKAPVVPAAALVLGVVLGASVRYFSTDAKASHYVYDGADPGPSTDWPLDFSSSTGSIDKITVVDLTTFTAPDRRLDTKPGDEFFDRRWDLIPGPPVGADWIQIGDLSALFAGSTGFPPMNNATKVFGTTFVCSPHAVYGD